MSKIAIITPTIGRGSLERAVESVRNQELGNEEVTHYIVSDGAGPIEVGESTTGRVVRTIEREAKGGPGAARNTGLVEALPDCNFVGFLDDDDWYTNDCLNTLISEIGDFDMIYGDLEIHKYTGHKGNWKLESKEVVFSRDWSFGVMKKTPYVPLPGCLFTTEFFYKYGLFREDIGRCMDWELIARGEANGARYKHIKKVVGFADWHYGPGTDNLSTQPDPMTAFPPCTWGRICTLVEGNYM